MKEINYDSIDFPMVKNVIPKLITDEIVGISHDDATTILYQALKEINIKFTRLNHGGDKKIHECK